MLETDRRTVELLDHQAEAYEASEPFVCIAAGVGSGKTWFGARWTIERACRFPGSRHLATANSYRQLHDVVAPELMRACEDLGLGFSWRKMDAELHLEASGSPSIICRTTERTSVDRLRGLELGSWWADEVRAANRYAVDVVFGRLRSRDVDRPRYLWTTTPNGFDHIYERHVERGGGNFRLVTAASDANPYLTADYLENVLGSYDAETARQERGGEFVAVGIGSAYHAFDRAHHLIDATPGPGDVVVSCDFNIGRMAWIVCQARSGGEVHALAEITGHDVYDTAETLVAWVDDNVDGQRLVIHGDPAGNSRDHAGRTDYARLSESLTAAGVRHVMKVAGSHPRQRDRVNAVNAMLENAKGERRLFIDSSCGALRRDLEQVRWLDSGKGLDKTDERLTHATDALGYYIHAEHRPQAFRREPGYRMASNSRSRSLRSRYA